MRMRERVAWGFAGAIALLAIAAVARVAQGGELDPPTSPGSTLRTLDELVPAWDQARPAPERFDLVLGGGGVLDKETGLVWEQNVPLGTASWATAQHICYTQRLIGNRRGWRLPTFAELQTLKDNTQIDPVLPTGHPFDGSISSSNAFWTATTDPANQNQAYGVRFDVDDWSLDAKSASHKVWCVRGGAGYDGNPAPPAP